MGKDGTRTWVINTRHGVFSTEQKSPTQDSAYCLCRDFTLAPAPCHAATASRPCAPASRTELDSVCRPRQRPSPWRHLALCDLVTFGLKLLRQYGVAESREANDVVTRRRTGNSLLLRGDGCGTRLAAGPFVRLARGSCACLWLFLRGFVRHILVPMFIKVQVPAFDPLFVSKMLSQPPPRPGAGP